MGEVATKKKSFKLKLNRSDISSLVKDNIKGVKVNGKWAIRLSDKKESLEASKDEHDEHDDSEVFVLNENVYKERLASQLEELKIVYEEVRDNINKKLELSNKIEELSKRTMATKDYKSKELAHFLDTSSVYQDVSARIDEVNAELSDLSQVYGEIEEVIDNIDVIEKIYSMTTESVYIIISREEFIKVINKASLLGKRVIILSENVFEYETVKIRFSNHIPYFYKSNKSVSGYREYRGTNVLIPYNKLGNSIVAESAKKYRGKQKVENLNNKLDRAKFFSSKKMKNLSNSELEEYHKISLDLLSNEDLKDNKFVSTLESVLIGLKRRLPSAN